MSVIINLAVFQAFWFGLVILGDWFLLPVCLWWILHYRIFASTTERQLLPIFTVAGLTMDHLFALIGVFKFPSELPILPIWMIGLWILFPTTLYHGLKWTWSGSKWIIPLCGIGASLNYVIGAKLASLSLPLGSLMTCFLLSLAWTAYLAFTRRIGLI